MSMSFRRIALVGVALACSVAHAATDWNAKDHDLYPGDFDGDGKTDVLFIAKDPSRSSGIARSDGSAPNTSFQTWPSNYLGIPWYGNNYEVIVADFNYDNRADILLQRKVAGDHFLLLANPAGKIVGISQTISNSSGGVVWSADQHRIVAGDFNGDGRADLFLQATARGGLNAVMLASSDGTFVSSPAQSWNDSPSPGGFKWSTQDAFVYAGDFNGDGRSDLLVQARPQIVMIDYDIPIPVPVHAPNMNGVLLAQNSATIFSSASMKAWSWTANGADWSPLAGSVVVGDFNGDGRADIILQANRAGQATRLVTADGSANVFGSSTAISANVSLDAASARLIAGKFSGASAAGLYIQALEQSGTNWIANSVSSSITASAHESAAATGVLPVNAAGMTDGSFAISDSGAASYSVPIAVPPGVSGIQPSLSINYQSGVGNGLLGVGWNLGGLSSITRCAKSRAQDNSNEGVQLTTADKFCLDGNRLRLTGGTYGASGSTYQTEIEKFARITANDTAGNGPAYFVMEAKDGRRFEFGNSTDARIESTASGKTTTATIWALNKVSDRYGNTMSISYEEDNGAYRPSNISYTANANASLTASYRVDFIWETRSDSLRYYFANGLILENKRLARIETLYRNPSNGSFGVVRQYRLSYNASGVSRRSRLGAIQECDGGGNCLSPTMISWNDGSKEWSSTTIELSDMNGAYYGNMIPIDFDADGRTDLIYPKKVNDVVYWHFKRASGSGGYEAGVQTAFVAGDDNNPYYSKTLPLDYYSDGRVGLLVQLPNYSTRKLLRWSGSTLEAIDTNITAAMDGSRWIGDFDGDGRTDFLYVSWANGVNSLHVQRNLGSVPGMQAQFASPELYSSVNMPSTVINPFLGNQASPLNGVFDFNADGRVDIMYRGDSTSCVPGGWQCNLTAYFGLMLSNGTSFVEGPTWICDGVDVVCPQPIIGDFNGDGLKDVLTPGSTGADWATQTPWVSWGVLYGTGSGMVPGGGINIAGVFPILAVDYDLDGKQDLLATPPTPGPNYVVLRSTGTDFDSPAPTNAPIGGGVPRALDVDGDGLTDIGYISVPDYQSYKVVLHGGAFPDLISSITDGFGNSVTPTYAPLSDASVYTKGSYAMFPELDYVRPGYVVKHYSQSDGVGGTYTVSATYGGARYHLQGRGGEGFAYRTETDSRTGIKETKNFYQPFPYTGLTRSIVITQPNGKVISEATNSYLALQTGTGAFEQRYYPYIFQTLSTVNEVSATNASLDGAPISETRTTNSLDSSTGNVTTMDVTVTDLTGTGKTYVRQFVDTYAPAEDSNWCSNVLTQRTVTSTVPGSAALTRTVQYLKDPTAPELCRVSQQTIEPGTSTLAVTTDFLYDTFGHVRQTTVSASGVAARVTTIDYGSKGAFPVSTTNAENEVTSADYDYAHGVPSWVKDESQVQTYFYYDGFGRKTREVHPDSTETRWVYGACTIGNGFCGDSRLRIQLTQQERDANGVNVIRSATQRFDSYGRALYDESQMMSGAYSVVRTNYNQRGLVAEQSAPYVASSGTAYFATFYYDLLGRQTQVQQPVSEYDSTAMATQISFARLTSSFVDANGHTTTTLYNALGQVEQVSDAAGNTQYEYDPFGNVRLATDAAGNQWSATFDRNGRMLTMSDPNLGSWGFEHYPTGELKKRTDAKLQEQEFTYDAMSRVKTRIEPEGTTTFTYGNTVAARNVGKLVSVVGPGPHSIAMTYDTFGRPADRTSAIDSVNYVISNSYSPTTGYLDTVTYPISTSAVPGSRFKVSYEYANGVLQRVRDFHTPADIYWEQIETDARGNAIDEQLGNGLRTYSTFDRVNGRLAERRTGATSQIQNQVYQWDRVGNLTLRSENTLGVTERFYYDAVNRLDYSTRNGVQNLDLVYNAIGNITSKSDVGSYTYHATKKNAVIAAGSHTYSYDANGNMATRDGSTLAWTSFNLPSQINSGSSSSQFFYGGLRERYKQVALSGPGGPLPAGTETTIYVDGLFEKVTKPSSVVEYKHHIVAGTGVVAVRTIRSDGTSDTRYLHKDHLRSVDAITDESGALVGRFSYAAFGERREAGTWSGAPLPAEWNAIAGVTHRGFTGHEHVDNVALIHMNGRVYDSVIGRFTSADPFVQDPLSSQGLNRYSYVTNNPLSMMDPSGFFGGKDPECWICNNRDLWEDWLPRGPLNGLETPLGPGMGSSLTGPAPVIDMSAVISQTLEGMRTPQAAFENGDRSSVSARQGMKSTHRPSTRQKTWAQALRGPVPANDRGSWADLPWYGQLSNYINGMTPFEWDNPNLSDTQIGDEIERWHSIQVTPQLPMAGATQAVAGLRIINSVSQSTTRAAGSAVAASVAALESPRAMLLRQVTDLKLRNRILALYRANAKVGNGSTADAIRYEKRTGHLLSPDGHVQKGIEMRNGLWNDIKSGRLSATDKSIALQLLKDLQNALSGQ